MILSFSVLVSAKSFIITIHGNYFSAADTDFSNRYGGKKIYPEGKIALKFFGNLFVWGSYGTYSAINSWNQWSNKTIENADIKVEDNVRKNLISGGLGYYIGYLEKNEFAVKIEVGVCKITNDYDKTSIRIASGSVITSETMQESGIGINGNFGITYGVYKNWLFTEANIGYLYVPDKIEDITINLGGLKLSLGLGIIF
jgi:hypothetical protein